MQGVSAPGERAAEGGREGLGWKHLRAPAVRWLRNGKATGAVLSFLEPTRVGEVANLRWLWEDEEEAVSEVDEDGVDPP